MSLQFVMECAQIDFRHATVFLGHTYWIGYKNREIYYNGMCKNKGEKGQHYFNNELNYKTVIILIKQPVFNKSVLLNTLYLQT